MLNVGGSAPSWSRRRMISASRTSSGCMAGAECSPPRPGVPPSAVARPCRATRAMNCCASARLPAACGPVESPSDPRRLGGLPPSPVPSPWGPLGRPVTVLPVSQPCSQAAQSNNRPGSSNMEVPVTGRTERPGWSRSDISGPAEWPGSRSRRSGSVSTTSARPELTNPAPGSDDAPGRAADRPDVRGRVCRDEVEPACVASTDTTSHSVLVGPPSSRHRGQAPCRRHARAPWKNKNTRTPVRVFHKGGAEGTRTPDPHTASVVRYQLRHSPLSSRDSRALTEYYTPPGDPVRRPLQFSETSGGKCATAARMSPCLLSTIAHRSSGRFTNGSPGRASNTNQEPAEISSSS